MHIARVFTGVAAATVAAVLVTGCGPGEEEAVGGDTGASAPATTAGAEESATAAPAEPLAVAITGPQDGVAESGSDMKDPPGKPGSSADFTTQIEYEIQKDVLQDAQVEGRTSADCPDGVTQKANATSKCTVTYEGVKVPYTVTIGSSYKAGDFLTPYRAEPDSMLLVAKRVYHEFWDQYGEGGSRKLSCDKMPAAEAVPEGEPTKYQCQVVGLGDDPSNVRLVKVAIESYGPHFTFAES